MNKNKNFFNNYKLEHTESGYVVTIFLSRKDTEFANENSYFPKNENEESDINIIKFVRDNFKDIKVIVIKIMIGSILIGTITFGGNINALASEIIPQKYIVKSGDSLWKISNSYGISIDQIKEINNLNSEYLFIGQELALAEENIVTKIQYEYYTVQAGDSLWKISNKFAITIDSIKTLNSMSGDVVFAGQKIKIREIKIQGILYIVKSGDTLWKIASENNSTINSIRDINKLTSDNLLIGQELFIPLVEETDTPGPVIETPKPVYNWPNITYIVEAGDTVSAVAKKFNVTTQNILDYNYMTLDEWLNAGDKIAISGYAPRTYTVIPGESTSPLTVGKLVDWTTEGQYILKRGKEFTVVDIYSGKQFKAKMLAGYNHCDMEPSTTADTTIMKNVFGTWNWNPRPVVIFVDGMNIAGSLSGMPHGVDLLAENGIVGHFDLYLHNSISHSTTTSIAYIQDHQDAVDIASGIK